MFPVPRIATGSFFGGVNIGKVNSGLPFHDEVVAKASYWLIIAGYIASYYRVLKKWFVNSGAIHRKEK